MIFELFKFVYTKDQVDANNGIGIYRGFGDFKILLINIWSINDYMSLNNPNIINTITPALNLFYIFTNYRDSHMKKKRLYHYKHLLSSTKISKIWKIWPLNILKN